MFVRSQQNDCINAYSGCCDGGQVVHYDLPKDTEAFLHRSGRTGRAGKTGSTIAVILPRDRNYFRRMCQEIKLQNVEYISPPGPKAVMEASAKQVLHQKTSQPTLHH